MTQYLRRYFFFSPINMSIVFSSALEQSRALQNKEISARELLTATLAQIDAVNPTVNAIITRDDDAAFAQADAVDAARAGAEALSPVAGLPIACKDMERTKGMRTTFGSPIYRNHVPDIDTLMVEKFRAHGMVILGKTNTPEFALGSQTFNTVFGSTKNPWDLSKTCGGSSGGAAAAVSTRMLPFADGSDLGASLRNPANFCNAVGLRPTPGRVPVWPAMDLWHNLAVHGPIARTAQDTALLLYAQAGGDRRSPNALWDDPAALLKPLARDFKGVRIAWSPTVGGAPVEWEVARALKAAVKQFEDLGCIVEEIEPSFAEADESFDTLRAFLLAQIHGSTFEKHRHQMKDTAVWNIERGLALTGAEIIEATRQHSRVFDRFRAFMERYEFLIAPCNQVLPFSIDMPYVTEINGVRLDNYLDWMKSCFRITMTAHPAISVPVAFSQGGLPIGMQIVGRTRDEFGLLQLSHAIEQNNRLFERIPACAKPA
jgi:amidase